MIRLYLLWCEFISFPWLLFQWTWCGVVLVYHCLSQEMFTLRCEIMLDCTCLLLDQPWSFDMTWWTAIVTTPYMLQTHCGSKHRKRRLHVPLYTTTTLFSDYVFLNAFHSISFSPFLPQPFAFLVFETIDLGCN